MKIAEKLSVPLEDAKPLSYPLDFDSHVTFTDPDGEEFIVSLTREELAALASKA